MLAEETSSGDATLFTPDEVREGLACAELVPLLLSIASLPSEITPNSSGCPALSARAAKNSR